MPEVRSSRPVLLFMVLECLVGEWCYWSPLSPLFFLHLRMLGVPPCAAVQSTRQPGSQGTPVMGEWVKDSHFLYADGSLLFLTKLKFTSKLEGTHSQATGHPPPSPKQVTRQRRSVLSRSSFPLLICSPVTSCSWRYKGMEPRILSGLFVRLATVREPGYGVWVP